MKLYQKIIIGIYILAIASGCVYIKKHHKKIKNKRTKFIEQLEKNPPSSNEVIIPEDIFFTEDSDQEISSPQEEFIPNDPIPNESKTYWEQFKEAIMG